MARDEGAAFAYYLVHYCLVAGDAARNTGSGPVDTFRNPCLCSTFTWPAFPVDGHGDDGSSPGRLRHSPNHRSNQAYVHGATKTSSLIAWVPPACNRVACVLRPLGTLVANYISCELDLAARPVDSRRSCMHSILHCKYLTFVHWLRACMHAF